MFWRLPLHLLLPSFALALAGCGGQVNTAFLGVAVAGILLVVTLGVLNYVTRGRDDRRTRVLRTVVIALLLLTMIGMLGLIVAQSGIGRI